MNISNFWNDPVGEILSAWVDVLGLGFYVFIMVIFVGFALLKTESWAAASVVAIFIAIIFAALLPAYFIFILAVMAALVLAAVLIDVIILK